MKDLDNLFSEEIKPFYTTQSNTDIVYLSGMDIFNLGYKVIEYDLVTISFNEVDVHPNTPRRLYIIDYDTNTIEIL